MEAHATRHEGGIRERLLSDHRKLDELLKIVLAAAEDGDREAIADSFTEFDSRLRTHLEAEECYLLPQYMRADPRAARVLLEEHKHLRARLVEIGTAIDLHTLRAENARAFARELQAHASHEDRLLYPWAEAHLREPERTSLLRSLVDRVMSRVRLGKVAL